VVAAIVDGQLTAPAAVKVAEARGLADVDGEILPPFRMEIGTARALARDERNRRAAKGAGTLSKVDRPVAARAIVNRVLDLLEQELRMVEKKRPGGQDAVSRIGTAERITTAASKVLRLERELNGPGQSPPQSSAKDKPKPDAEAKDIAAEARKRAKSAEQPRTQPTTQEQEALGLRVAEETSDEVIGGDPNPAAESQRQATSGLVSTSSTDEWDGHGTSL
jgi:hypothetical protein